MNFKLLGQTETVLPTHINMDAILIAEPWYGSEEYRDRPDYVDLVTEEVLAAVRNT